ncbi:MAG TPA: T9SS type A sorting domain-containing protein [Prolixibacteraceae bacterium]|mgnify:FL=1|nr:T9SS type A sorting domain-containing protein [Prolixibacteraceae bacterium]
MRFKLLLLLLLASCGLVSAQQANMNVIFSEVRMDQWHHSYVEICNMGNVAVDLAQFEVGSISPWTSAFDAEGNPTFDPGADGRVMLPAKMLNPGETFVIATVYDWAKEMAIVNPERYGPLTKNDTWKIADMQIHRSEAPTADPTDSISTGFSALACWNGSYCFYLRHHFTDADSVVVDVVNGDFTGADYKRPKDAPSDVAGVVNATVNSILVRKASVKTGTGSDIDAWDRVRGLDLTDSEWLPVPILVSGGWEAGRKEFWTLGNHGNYRLDANSLKSNTIGIDWTANTMSVAWGARNFDSIMNEFDYAPGIAWHYFKSPSKLDSAYTSVRTGDSLVLYATGNQLDRIGFKLTALAPTDDECRVVPKNARDGNGGWYTPYVVTEGASLDSIREVAFDTRVDTLMKYLEKPEKATWQLIFVDGVVRPDVKLGDKLKVTSANGKKIKEYYIKVEDYLPSHNADLSSITWPDIPEHYRGLYGWKGDTIPAFAPTKFNYKVEIPYDVPGIPAFVAKPENTDAQIQVKRAATLAGSVEDRTIKYTVTAEDDTTINVYSIELSKEQDLTNVQPFVAEPFISQFVFRADWRQTMIEICNPGNQELDLSRYLLVMASTQTTLADAFAVNTTVDDYANRYNRYVPGYVWQDESNWAVQPAMLEQDFSVNTIVAPGDVFVIAWADRVYKDRTTVDYPGFDQIDVNFKNGFNPWGIELSQSEDGYSSLATLVGGWLNNTWILYKILNDSVLNGIKPLTDPADVQAIDVIGRLGGNAIGSLYGQDVKGNLAAITYVQNSGLKRLPQYYKGNINPGESFGDTTSKRPAEWLFTNDAYWTAKGYGWPTNNSMNSDGIGSHEFNTITEFISTISSVSFVVSKGYSMSESIVGPAPGITADEFLSKILKADPLQQLTLTRGETTLTGADELVNGDQLTVVSANKNNTTKYIINVAENALDDNALLTSTVYQIDVTDNTGTITGFAPGTLLKTVFNGVTAPETASLFTVYNADGTYASFKNMTVDTFLVDVVATDMVFFEVLAQNGVNKITYQLLPNSTQSDAYVLSNDYMVDQTSGVISLIPDGINVTAFMNMLIAAPGATMELQNNMGQVREMGTIYVDDKLVVTAADGTTTKVYTLKMYSETVAARRAFAYSDEYLVNQTKLTITLPYGTEISISDFADMIYLSAGATFVVKNSDGSAKESGNLAKGDKIVVTSEDGTKTRTYTIAFAVSAPVVKQGNMKVYPNPTTGDVKITGIESGNLVTIFNTSGSRIASFKAASSFEQTAIEGPSGMYFIVVQNENAVVGRFKVIKK